MSHQGCITGKAANEYNDGDRKQGQNTFSAVHLCIAQPPLFLILHVCMGVEADRAPSGLGVMPLKPPL
jgi:hypothetical protein